MHRGNHGSGPSFCLIIYSAWNMVAEYGGIQETDLAEESVDTVGGFLCFFIYFCTIRKLRLRLLISHVRVRSRDPRAQPSR
jgi:hypothetical protein